MTTGTNPPEAPPAHPAGLGRATDEQLSEKSVLLGILFELRAINARLDRAETAGHAAAKVFHDSVAPWFQRLASNPKIARFLK